MTEEQASQSQVSADGTETAPGDPSRRQFIRGAAAVGAALFDAAESQRSLVFVPTYRGRRGHPVAFDASLLAELRAVSEEELGLRAVVRRHANAVAEVPVASAMVLWNLNRPEDYVRAHVACFGVAPPGSASG